MSDQSSVLENPKWQTNRILSSTGSQYKYLWFFAIFWNTFVWFAIILGGENILKAFEESPVFYLFVTFPFIGLFIIYQAIKETIAWRKFGETPLTMDPFPGQLGGIIGGYVDVPIPFDATHQIKVSLSCVHHFIKRSGGETESIREILWQDNSSVRSKISATGSRIHFEFQPPPDLPASESDSKDYHSWNVQISLPLEGLDFERIFTIPVIKASEQAIVSSSRYTRSSIDQVSQTTVGSDLAIPRISIVSGGTRFFYPQYRNKGMGVGLMGAGIFLSVFLWFMYQEFTDFLPMTSMVFFGFSELISTAVFIFGVYMISNTLTVDVGVSGIKIRHKLFGFDFGGEIERSMIADFIVEKSGSFSDGKSSRVWYSLTLIQKNGKESTVGDTLEGFSHAQTVRQKMIDALGPGWIASEIPEKQNRVTDQELPFLAKVTLKTLQKVFSLLVPAALIYDFREPFFQIVQFVGTLL